MKNTVHDRIEAIAGAIALDEATDDERREYREHIAACESCLRALGGEREMERVASTVSEARDSEVWEPALGDVVATRLNRRARKLRWGLGTLGVAVAASLGIHALVAAGVGPIAHPQAAPVVINAGVTRIVLEQNAAPTPVPVVPAQPKLIVTHNVVQIARAPVSIPAAAAPSSEKSDKPRQLIAITVHPDTPPKPQAHSNVPVWRRPAAESWRTVAQTTTTSVTETAPQTLTHSAESLEVSGVTREVAPIGGETAINPQPAAIAYAENAQGTTVFEVRVDERGAPTKCIVTKGSGYRVLDDAVCKAAMNARYTPKMIDGHAVVGLYHDAFTFHMSDQPDQGVPPQIPDVNRSVRAHPQIGPPQVTPQPGGINPNPQQLQP